MNLVLYEELASRVMAPSLDRVQAWCAELTHALQSEDVAVETMLCFFVALCGHHHEMKDSVSFPSPTVTSPVGGSAPTTTVWSILEAENALLPLLVERIKQHVDWQAPSTVFALKAINAVVQRAKTPPPCTHLTPYCRPRRGKLSLIRRTR